MDGRGRIALTLTGVALYAVASHELMTRAADSAVTLAFVLGPMLVAAVGSVWSTGHRGLALGLAAAMLVVLAAATQGRGVPSAWLYLAQHAGLHAALGIWFGSSLRKEPLITQLAARLHALPPAERVYTRHCTVAWVAYFAAMTLASLLLFALAPFAAWSLFANVLTPLSLAAMFVGEHLVRYRLHPEFERVGLVAAARAFSAGGAR